MRLIFKNLYVMKKTIERKIEKAKADLEALNKY